MIDLQCSFDHHQCCTRLTIDSLVNSSYGYGRFVDLSIAPADLLVNPFFALLAGAPTIDDSVTQSEFEDAEWF